MQGQVDPKQPEQRKDFQRPGVLDLSVLEDLLRYDF